VLYMQNKASLEPGSAWGEECRMSWRVSNLWS